MDDPDKVKQATSGLENIKQEAFEPDKVEQAAAGHGQGRMNRWRPTRLEGAGWLLPALDGCQAGINVWDP